MTATRLRTSPNYQILALCNSSLESTKAAIQAHDLPAETRAYASPEELAADKDVDLIVISTRVDTHDGLATTAANAGKNTYVEWPLGSNADQARQLVSLAKEKGIKTVVGLQGRREPSVLTAKEIVASGRLGTIHSVNVHSTVGIWQNGAVGERYDYMLDRKVGGNALTIYTGHTLDTIFFVHGELKKGYSTLLGNLRPRMHKMAGDGKISDETFAKDTPDQVSDSRGSAECWLTGRCQILLQGRFDTGSAPVFSFHQRAGNKFSDKPGLTWRVYGDKAEMLIEVDGGSPHIGSPTKISICDGDTGKVDEVALDQSYEGLGMPSANIGALFDAYAEGKGYADWEVALKRHELIEEFYAGGM